MKVLRILCLVLFVNLISCTKNEVINQITEVVDEYSKCQDFDDLLQWVGQDGRDVVMDNATYSIEENYFNRPVVMISIDDDNAQGQLLEMSGKLNEIFKNNDRVDSVYFDQEFVCVLLCLNGFELE